jgi:hypothetical protein
MVRVLEDGWSANEIAGEALAAMRAGRTDEAIRLARESGRSTMRSVAAATDTVLLATGAARSAATLGERWRGRPRTELPAPDPPRRVPEPEPLPAPRDRVPPPDEAPPRVAPPRSEVDPIEAGPRPDGLTGRVADGVPAGEPQRRVRSAPHAAFKEVPVSSREVVRTELDIARGRYAGEQARLAEEMRSLEAARRRDPKVRNPAASDAIRLKERISALESQLVHPDRAYLVQAHVDVVLPDGRVMTGADIAGTGRVPDVFEGFPDGRFSMVEYKTETTIREAFPKRGGVEVPALKRSSKPGDQLSREQRIVDYAKANGGRLRISAEALDGTPVRLEVEPGRYRGSSLRRYGELAN